jgi:hypothetical protein
VASANCARVRAAARILFSGQPGYATGDYVGSLALGASDGWRRGKLPAIRIRCAPSLGYGLSHLLEVRRGRLRQWAARAASSSRNAWCWCMGVFNHGLLSTRKRLRLGRRKRVQARLPAAVTW